MTLNKKRNWIVTAALVFTVFMSTLQSFDAQAKDGESRTDHRIGIYASVLGDPFPSLFGFNLAFNLASFLRINAGYGSASVSFPAVLTAPSISLTTYSAGLKLFIPHWRFSPVVGMNYSRATISVTGSLATGQDLYGLAASTNILYSTLGFDWQTHYGLNFGFGYNLSFKEGVPGLPFIQLGWFF